MSGISFKSGLSLVASVAMMTTAAQADVLLDVDLSVPNQLTVTATTGLSAVTTSGGDATGVYFADFYSIAGTAIFGNDSPVVSADLTNAANPSNGSPLLKIGRAHV